MDKGFPCSDLSCNNFLQDVMSGHIPKVGTSLDKIHYLFHEGKECLEELPLHPSPITLGRAKIN
jgi:hypothetical protein